MDCQANHIHLLYLYFISFISTKKILKHNIYIFEAIHSRDFEPSDKKDFLLIERIDLILLYHLDFKDFPQDCQDYY